MANKPNENTGKYQDSSTTCSFAELIELMDTPKQKPIPIENEDQKKFARVLTELSCARAENSAADMEKSSKALNELSIHIYLSRKKIWC